MASSAGFRLAVFGMVLAGSFGTAYAAGERWPGHDHASGAGHDHGTGHDHGGHVHRSAAAPPATTMAGYTLMYAPGSDPLRATFSVRTPTNGTLTDFAIVHQQPLHAIILRPDLSGFEHVHPTIGVDGRFTVEFPDDGPWHVVADFTAGDTGTPLILAANIDDDAPYDTVTLPPMSAEADAQGITVHRRGLMFIPEVSVAEIEPYLGQPAHLVAFRQSDLAYVHLHPAAEQMNDMLMFDGDLEPGTWRMFLQFQYGGTLHLAEYTVVVP
jgi:hypothetical protein